MKVREGGLEGSWRGWVAGEFIVSADSGAEEEWVYHYLTVYHRFGHEQLFSVTRVLSQLFYL